MEALRFINKINDREIDFLYHLINKNIWSIESDNVNIDFINQGAFKFCEWIKITIFDGLYSYFFKYNYDETYAGDDFITLSIEAKEDKERKLLNSSISFTRENFKIKKIELYAEEWLHKTIWDMDSRVVGNVSLIKNSEFQEYIYNQNILLIYAEDNKRILIMCRYSYLELVVTQDENFIKKFFKEGGEYIKLVNVIE